MLIGRVTEVADVTTDELKRQRRSLDVDAAQGAESVVLQDFAPCAHKGKAALLGDERAVEPEGVEFLREQIAENCFGPPGQRNLARIDLHAAAAEKVAENRGAVFGRNRFGV